MRASAVIGACFGDEGKGLLTDYLSDENTLVVRFNGGGQAGHTVVTPDGKRHAFAHVGAGAFRGAHTFLSRYFLVDPRIWCEEMAELYPLGVRPIVYVDPDAFLVTPFDVFVNQELERSRGNQRHGSCGSGINETVTRCTESEVPTRVSDIATGALESKVSSLRAYAFKRIKNMTGSNPSEYTEHLLNSPDVVDDWMESCAMFIQEVLLPENAPKGYSNVVFEGAQGLLLDEKHHYFPHVTRSRTGLTNVVPLCLSLGIRNLDVYYVMRSYMTRHGAGPFPSEVHGLSFFDDTNNHNAWQGTLRFGSFDEDLVRQAISRDLNTVGRSVPISASACVTHVDQHADMPRVGLPVRLVSHGRTRENVTAHTAALTLTGG